MGSKNDLSNRINESYSKLSKGQKLLATYITDNYDKAVFLTAAKLPSGRDRRSQRIHGCALCHASWIPGIS